MAAAGRAVCRPYRNLDAASASIPPNRSGRVGACPCVSTDGEPFLNTKSVPAGITHGVPVAPQGGVVPGYWNRLSKLSRLEPCLVDHVPELLLELEGRVALLELH